MKTLILAALSAFVFSACASAEVAQPPSDELTVEVKFGDLAPPPPPQNQTATAERLELGVGGTVLGGERWETTPNAAGDVLNPRTGELIPAPRLTPEQAAAAEAQSQANQARRRYPNGLSSQPVSSSRGPSISAWEAVFGTPRRISSGYYGASANRAHTLARQRDLERRGVRARHANFKNMTLPDRK